MTRFFKTQMPIIILLIKLLMDVNKMMQNFGMHFLTDKTSI